MNASTTTKSCSRKRCRPVVAHLGLAAVAVLCGSSSLPTVSTFTTFSLANPAITTTTNARSSIPKPPHSLLLLSATTQQAPTLSHPTSTTLSSGPARLSAEEQRELLLQAIEARRIKTLESELAIPKKTLPLISVRCKAAGYGDDIEAYETALEDGERARESLITTNMGLVYYCVNEIIGTKAASKKRLNSLSREDLIQEGSIGLARAIDRWNPAIGGKFSTYAVYWVRAAILRCIAEKDDMLRIPEHVSATVRKMTRGAQRLGLELDSEEILSTASWKEAKAARALAEEAGLTDSQLTQAMRIRSRRNAGGYVEFSDWMQKGRDIESDVSLAASRDEVLRGMEVEDLKKTLGRYLRPKEMEALFWRYGLLSEKNEAANKNEQPKDYLARAEVELFGDSNSNTKTTASPKSLPVKGKWGEAMSFTEVGNRMEVSAEYGRRLCHAALKKLQTAAEDGLLEPALLC